MAKLKIPERYKPGLVILRKLEDIDINLMISSLYKLLNTINMSEVEETVMSSLKLSSTDAQSFIETILSLYATINNVSLDITLDEFVKDLCDALLESNSPDLQITKNEYNSFNSRLKNVLSIELFKILAKAGDLQTENERTFCNARIITDIRPVFSSQIENGFKGAVMFHTLQIKYYDANRNDGEQEFYVALDFDDLNKLKQTTERAIEKYKSLSNSLNKIGITFYNI